MKEELKQKPVLAMYDVRGIQNYIFSTNRIKDIIGASKLVENIITDGLKAVCKEQEKYMVDWENDKADAFLKDETIDMQVLFVGGGNAYVLFRKGEICEKVNRALAKYVLDNTYSLNLAVAVVEKTEDYSVDYEAINLKMRDIKSVMPETKPFGAFPFMEIDSHTGYPASEYDKTTKEYISTEAKLKRKHVPKDVSAEKILDNMVTQKGENSTLAVVHIDGNSMGERIKMIMAGKTDYTEAICAMREISRNLKNEFNDCYKQMCTAVDNISDSVKPEVTGKLYRKIIVAGDDITFICNAKVALFAVEKFLKQVTTKVMYQDTNLSDEENKKKYTMSACAGVAFFNSHFPFSDAYEVAEACCSNAKKVAKLKDNRGGKKEDGMVGNYVDYQICNHIKATDLDLHRTKNYFMPDEKMMICRPYYVKTDAFNQMFEIDSDRDIENLWENLTVFRNKDVGKNRYKKLRNAYSLGLGEVEKERVFLESRGIPLPGTQIISWYDALEIIDICELGGKKDDITN